MVLSTVFWEVLFQSLSCLFSTLPIPPPLAKPIRRLVNGPDRLWQKKPFKLVAVALANKMARIAWAVMAHKTTLQPGLKGMAASSLIKMNA